MSALRLEPYTPAPTTHASGIKTGSVIHIAGQVGIDEAGNVPSGFAEQVKHALKNVLAVVAKGGGRPDQVVRLTWYVTSVEKYHASVQEVGAAFRAAFGDHLPAMTLVGVTGLVDPRFLVEVDGQAVVG